jgi:hypothetical protein
VYGPCRAVRSNEAYQHSRKELQADQEALEQLQAQRAELDAAGLALKLEAATVARETAHVAHEQ